MIFSIGDKPILRSSRLKGRKKGAFPKIIWEFSSNIIIPVFYVLYFILLISDNYIIIHIYCCFDECS